MRPATIDVDRSGVPGRVELRRALTTTPVHAAWSEPTLDLALQNQLQWSDTSVLISGYLGVEPRDAVLAALGAHRLGLYRDGTWLTVRFLERLQSCRARDSYAPRDVYADVAAMIAEHRSLCGYPPAKNELCLALRLRSGALRAVSPVTSVRAYIRRARASGALGCREWTLDHGSARRGFLPGRRPTFLAQAVELGRTPMLAVDASTIATLALDKTVELAWADKLIDATDARAVAAAPDLVRAAYQRAGVASDALMDRLIDELVLPSFVQASLDSLHPEPIPDEVGSRLGKERVDSLDGLPAVIEHLAHEGIRQRWRPVGARLALLDRGLPDRLGTGVFLLEYPTSERMKETIALVDEGVCDWDTLVDLVAAGLTASDVRSLRGRGLARPDEWFIAHRQQADNATSGGRAPAPSRLVRAAIEERIDRLSLARLWQVGVRDLHEILDLHSQGLTAGDLVHFERAGIRDRRRMSELNSRGVDGYTASALVAAGHTHPERWPTLSPRLHGEAWWSAIVRPTRTTREPRREP